MGARLDLGASTGASRPGPATRAVEGPAPGLATRVRALVADRRGAVMAEAVIMLPVLILIWGIILYIHLGFREAQGNMAAVRSDAWVHAFGSCKSSASAPTTFGAGDSFDGESRGGISGLADAMRFVTSSVFMIDEFSASRTRDITRPNTLGGDTHTLRWDLLMLCNEPSRGDEDPLWEMWADLGFSSI